MLQELITIFLLITSFLSIGLYVTYRFSVKKRTDFVGKINLKKLEEDLKKELSISSTSSPIHRLSQTEFRRMSDLTKKYLKDECGKAIYEDLFIKFFALFISGVVVGSVLTAYFLHAILEL